jgi:hypothetical protein
MEVLTLVALGVPGKGVTGQFRIDHGPAGVARLVARCAELEPDPAEVRVVLETRHGLLVEALADAGFTVLPVNPDLVARRRGPAKKKDDSEFTVARRLAYNRPLGEAVRQWAFCSLTRSGWAREFYDEKTAAGDSHHSALRKLGNRWLEVLWHCLHKGVRYDEAVHERRQPQAEQAASRRRSRGARYLGPGRESTRCRPSCNGTTR